MGQVIGFDKNGTRTVGPSVTIFPVKDFLNAVNRFSVGQIFLKKRVELPIAFGESVKRA
jgi:hypothetical protein